MKRFLISLMILAMVLTSAFAGDFEFVFADLDQHTELLKGFLPTYIEIGAGYNGFQFMENRATQLRFTVAGGYTQSFIYQNPNNGAPISFEKGETVGVYDSWKLQGNLQLRQGLGEGKIEGLDLFTAYAGYKLRWEKKVDSILLTKGSLPKSKDNNRALGLKNPSEVMPVEDWINQTWSEDKTKGRDVIFPNFTDPKAVTNTLYTGLKLNLMDDRMVTTDGILGEFKLEFAPGFINKVASYYSASVNGVFAKTLYELQQKNGKNMFSVVLIDRVNASYTDGKKVPLYAQSGVSLGRKVRGFNGGSFNTNFAAVNNFDIRFASPEPWLDGLFARLNLFLDAGYYAGRYFNSDIRGDGFLASTGAQLELCIYDIIDLGIECSYLLSGTNAKKPVDKLIIGATFFLDF